MDKIKTIDSQLIGQVSERLFEGVAGIIDNAMTQVAVYVNSQSSITFWNVGRYIIDDLDYQNYSAYGQKILATLSQRLMARYGKGYTYSALTRMMKVARIYNDGEMFATLSQTLSWSHFLELITIENASKRLFYQQMGIAEHWSVNQLRRKQDEMAYERSVIAAKPDDEIVETLSKITPQHSEPDAVLKSSYVLDFLGLSGYYSEDELEANQFTIGESLKWSTIAHWKTNPYFKELNEKNIYLQYAEEQQKYNHTIPTSIRIFDNNLAKSIFGFEPKFVNYDFLQGNDVKSFHPRYYVPYETNR